MSSVRSRSFHLHYLTIALLAISSCALMWLNIKNLIVTPKIAKVMPSGETLRIIECGWPFPCWRKYMYKASLDQTESVLQPDPDIDYIPEITFVGGKTTALIGNIFLGVSIVLGLMVLSEWLIRHIYKQQP